MLSAYSWSQFSFFTLALVVVYYLGVGLLYYRTELNALLTRGQMRRAGQLTGANHGPAAPPALVRPTSAFAPATLATAHETPQAATQEADSATAAEQTELEQSPAAGADQNLPQAAELLVGGTLPTSTSTATGQDESQGDTVPIEAAAAASDEALALDESRTEVIDEADEYLAALVRRQVQQGPGSALEMEAVRQRAAVIGVEPLASFDEPSNSFNELIASFNEPVASPRDIVSAPTPQLAAATSVVEYLALLQTGQQPTPPAELAGTSLAEQMVQQMAQQMTLSHAELNDLFGPEEE